VTDAGAATAHDTGLTDHRPHDTFALPRSFEAHYGQGLDRAISFGGGGVFFVAWQLAYLKAIVEARVNLGGARRVVGTSAGSITAVAFTSKRVARLHDELALISKVPALVSALAPVASLNPSQERALAQFRQATHASPELIRQIGFAALAASTPSEAAMRRNVGLVVRARRWPSHKLVITAVDCYTGERIVIRQEHGVPPADAIAASSAVPGLFPPQRIGDRRCMDGGVSGTGVHLDLVAGARRVLVLKLNVETDTSGMTGTPADIEAENRALVESGSAVLVRSPETVDLELLMSPQSVAAGLHMGREQGKADADMVSAFWALPREASKKRAT
jgi:NTE family protein